MMILMADISNVQAPPIADACPAAVSQGQPITVPGTDDADAGDFQLLTAETAPHVAPGPTSRLSPINPLTLATSAPATEMPSVERVRCVLRCAPCNGKGHTRNGRPRGALGAASFYI